MTMRYDFDSGDPVDHPQVTVDVALGPQTLTIKVDENLAELVKALWARGFRTVASCQNQHGGGLAWIGFENQSMAVRFAGMVPSAQIVKMAAEARERADLADPFLHGAVAVTFPAALIDRVTRQFT